MRILITNDDGIKAPGLRILKQIADEIAGPAGEVWTIAPLTEQSGVGHCVSYSRATALRKFSEKTFAIDGSPADCVLAALYEVMPDHKPDLVLSGVNRGNNAAENTLYSGTVGAVIEAALQGIPGIALSQYYGPDTRHMANPFEAAALHGPATVRALLERGIWSEDAYRVFYNVNFPPVRAADVKGQRITRQGFRHGTSFSMAPSVDRSGRRLLWIKGGAQNVHTAPGTDAMANLDGYISITPMRADLTAHDLVDALSINLNSDLPA